MKLIKRKSTKESIKFMREKERSNPKYLKYYTVQLLYLFIEYIVPTIY